MRLLIAPKVDVTSVAVDDTQEHAAVLLGPTPVERYGQKIYEINHVVPVPNRHEDKKSKVRILRDDLLAEEPNLGQEGFYILGYAHSHIVGVHSHLPSDKDMEIPDGLIGFVVQTNKAYSWYTHKRVLVSTPPGTAIFQPASYLVDLDPPRSYPMVLLVTD